MTIAFLGHKRQLLDFIGNRVSEVAAQGEVVADIFCGTGAVSQHLQTSGYQVLANDHLSWCSEFTRAGLIQRSPRFDRLFAEVPELQRRSINGQATRYSLVLDFLNELAPKPGFMCRNYSPASKALVGVERMYFTEENAGRIDAIRDEVEAWRPLLSGSERALLLRNLIEAADAVSNVAGTYGCYLKHWKPGALEPLRLRPTSFSAGGNGATSHEVYCMNAAELAPQLECGIVYADPPYTKRQYAAYYHILETVARWDNPPLSGSTGLRPWQERSSDWCYRTRAGRALSDLVAQTRCRHFFLSYSTDGHIKHDAILRILGRHGRVRTFEISHRRYKSSRRRYSSSSVIERLYHLDRQKQVRA